MTRPFGLADRKTGSGGRRRQDKAGGDAPSPVLHSKTHDVANKLKSRELFSTLCLGGRWHGGQSVRKPKQGQEIATLFVYPREIVDGATLTNLREHRRVWVLKELAVENIMHKLGGSTAEPAWT